MRIRFVRPGNMAQAIASYVSTPQQFACEIIPALREAAAADCGGPRIGEHR